MNYRDDREALRRPLGAPRSCFELDREGMKKGCARKNKFGFD